MTHLTDEQFEDVVQGLAAEPAHLAECQACRDRLAERRAVRDRLRSAMASVRPEAALADRIRRATETARVVPAAAPAKRPAHRPLPRLAWASLAAAAVILIAVTTIFYLTTPNSAQAELVRIHEANLSAGQGFYAEADPAKLAEYLKTELGFQPAAPQLGQGMAMRGCCVAHFQGHAVGSYVVKTPRGSLSIIVVPQTPAQLGMTHTFQAGGKACWSDTFATNNMVAVRLGDYTYCAIGEVPQELLTQILLALGLGETP